MIRDLYKLSTNGIIEFHFNNYIKEKPVSSIYLILIKVTFINISVKNFKDVYLLGCDSIYKGIQRK
jgi:hypothetical protein